MAISATSFFTVGRSPVMETLSWHGLKIRLRAYQLKGEPLRKIGINPNYWSQGVEVCLAMPHYFKSIMQIMGVGEGKLGGIYHPKLGKVLVPENVSQLELCHEVLHALFDAQSPAEQASFSRLVTGGLQRDPGSRFFKGIARRSNGDRVFVTEVFAFAGTKVIFERMGRGEVEHDLGEVPPELKGYFERSVVDPRLLQAAA